VRIIFALAIAFTSAVLLASCASRVPAAAIDDDKCRSYGFVPGSDGYAQCRMSMDISRQQACSAAMNAKEEGPAVSPFAVVGSALNTAAACRH